MSFTRAENPFVSSADTVLLLTPASHSSYGINSYRLKRLSNKNKCFLSDSHCFWLGIIFITGFLFFIAQFNFYSGFPSPTLWQNPIFSAEFPLNGQSLKIPAWRLDTELEVVSWVQDFPISTDNYLILLAQNTAGFAEPDYVSLLEQEVVAGQTSNSLLISQQAFGGRVMRGWQEADGLNISSAIDHLIANINSLTGRPNSHIHKGYQGNKNPSGSQNPLGNKSGESNRGGESNQNKSRSPVVPLKGGGFEIKGLRHFSQGDNDIFAEAGRGWRPQGYCGPVAMQMVLDFYGVKKSRDYLALTNPETGQVHRSESYNGQMYVKGVGSVYSVMVKMAKSLGFDRTRQVWLGNDLDALMKLLQTGRPQIVSVRGMLRFTSGRKRNTPGHILLLRGVGADGELLVNDPALKTANVRISAKNFLEVWQGFTIDVHRSSDLSGVNISHRYSS